MQTFVSFLARGLSIMACRLAAILLNALGVHGMLSKGCAEALCPCMSTASQIVKRRIRGRQSQHAIQVYADQMPRHGPGVSRGGVYTKRI